MATSKNMVHNRSHNEQPFNRGLGMMGRRAWARVLPLLFLLGAWPGFSRADVLVSYGGTDYVSANANFARTATRTVSGSDVAYTTAFSDASPLSPASGYTGPTFYGGYSLAADGVTSIPSTFSQQDVYNSARNTAYDDIYVQSYGGAGWANGATLSVASAFVFKLAAPASLTSLDLVASNNIANTAFQTNSQWRWIIQAGGNYYVSQTSFNLFSGYTPYEASLTDLSSTQWAAYAPGAGLNFDQNHAVYANVDTSDVTAAGIYFENDSWTGNANTIGFEFAIQSFTANGIAATPEPKTTALLLFGLLAGAGATAMRTEMRRLL